MSEGSESPTFTPSIRSIVIFAAVGLLLFLAGVLIMVVRHAVDADPFMLGAVGFFMIVGSGLQYLEQTKVDD